MLIFTGVLVVVVILGLAAGYYYSNYQKLLTQQNQPVTEQSATVEAVDLRDRIAALAVIPVTETPTVATVTDVSKLKDQLFFQNAENGDKIVAFAQSEIAVLYRPSSNKIVWMGPLLETQTGTPTPTASPSIKP
jgi:hypothetical protein